MLNDLILKNRSYRSFDSSRKISKDELTSIIEMARKIPSARNLQAIKYKLCYTEEDCAKLFPLTAWAGALRPLVLPPKGHEPTGYVIICTDSDISTLEQNRFLGIDIGIAAQTIMLSATEMGLGGCMLGAFSAEKVSDALALDKKYVPTLILALGKPDEKVVLHDEDEITAPYYRDEDGIHHVPKRKLEDIII